jgi:hypothetical protein
MESDFIEPVRGSMSAATRCRTDFLVSARRTSTRAPATAHRPAMQTIENGNSLKSSEMSWFTSNCNVRTGEFVVQS